MSEAILLATPRTDSGSRPAGRQRRSGLVPAVVYGLGEANSHVTVDARELSHILAGESGANTLISLKIDKTEELALARQIQRHPVRGDVLHVDFVRVRADVEVSAEVPIHLVGESEGVRNGGLIEQSIFSLTVMARPGNIPSEFEVDVSALNIGDQIRVEALAVPEGVTITTDGDELVVLVAAPTVAEVAEPVEGEEIEGEGGEAAEGEAAPEGGEGE